MKITVAISSVCLAVLLLGCAKPKSLPVLPSGEGQRDGTGFGTSMQYWANPREILARDWYLVVVGTVRQTQVGPEEYLWTPVHGIIDVQEVLYCSPECRRVDKNRLKTLQANGFHELKAGDKVIVFVNEYDGGDGIVPVSGTNCRMGMKLKGWNDPFLQLVRDTAKTYPEYDERRWNVYSSPRVIPTN